MMFLYKTLFWTFFFIFYLICSTNPVESSCNSEPLPVAKVINHLSFRITDTIGGNDNLFFSPLSISLAMGMVYLGATDNTAEEIRSALGYNLLGNTTDEEVHLHFHSFLTDLGNGGDEYQLLIANSLFTQVGYDVLQEYANNLGLYYHAQQDSLDFASNGEEAIRIMNSWVSNKTKSKIPQLFQTPLDTTTILVLLNAVYFKGAWKYPFDSEASHYRNFYGYNGPKRIMFMRQTKRLDYYYDEESDHDFLELLYKGNHISMVFALPRSENVSILDFNSETLCRVRNGFRRTSVEAYIPRFKLNYEKELSDIMKRFGINSAFDDNAALLLASEARMTSRYLSFNIKQLLK
uniref:U3-Deinotoxin-Dsu1a_1 n=1 Tax=Deinopis subrufa TaxID=1905329 RepID=A0A4Q8K4A1_DEISU